MVLDVKNLVPGQTKAMLGKTKKTEKKESEIMADSADSSDSDSVNITSQAGQIGRLVAQMKAEPAMNPDRVSPVKDKLDKDDYDIDFEQVANKMLDFESSYYGY
jgi:flagellar biosynthesis anti-sigma factor FlgM